MSERARRQMDARLKARRDRVVRARLRRRRRVAASLAVLVAVLAGGIGVAMSPLADISEVRVTGVDGPRRRQVRAVADVHPGENLLTADLAAVSRRVEGVAWVHTAVVQRQPLSTVEIAVAVRTPVAAVVVGDDVWLVDDQAVVVAQAEDLDSAADGLALIHADNSVMPGVGGTVRDVAVRNALETRARLPDTIRSRVARYEAPSPHGLRLTLDNGVTVRIGRAEQVGEKARAIALLLSQARATAEGGRADGQPAGSDASAGGDAAWGSRIAEIDVRAPDHPVLVPSGRATPSP